MFSNRSLFMAGLEGRVLDRYELQQLIGKGGMAAVYLGYDSRFEREVAVKVFQRDDEDLLRRFIREARLMSSLHHPHLMPVYDTGQILMGGFAQYYIVMPYMEGGTLRQRIHRTPLALKTASVCLQELAGALDYIHAHGIIHRDIKSSNVLLDAEGRCYLADFGIARTSGATVTTQTGGLLGTVDYMAPELFEFEDYKADARSDLYSLGVLLFEMVTGRVPFTSENRFAVISMHLSKQPPSPRAFIPSLSSQVEHVMLRALEKRPERRYGSASELAEAFRLAVDGRLEEAAITERDHRNPAAPLVLPPVLSGYDEQTHVHSYQGTHVAREAPSHVGYPAQSEIPSSRPSSSRARGRVLTTLALVALLAVLGPMVYVLLSGQYQANNVGTIGGVATPNLTATARAQASATAGVLQTATAGPVVYQDALTMPDSNATQNERWNQNANCTFQQDGYHVTTFQVLPKAVADCRESSTRYTNMTVSVDMRILRGQSGGLLFYINSRVIDNAGYFFEVDTQGNYMISRSQDFETGLTNVVMQGRTYSAALKTGTGASNTLQVIARNGTLLFYINGTFVSQQQDSTFTAGYLGFGAAAAKVGQSADIVYTNITIYQQT
jgi:eukaryotic-like serine/threonine-protein kinase